MPKALITGAAGFVGGHLTRKLVSEGWEVHCLLGKTCSRDALLDIQNKIQIHYHDGSMSSMLAIMKSVSPDIVFHLAALFISEHQVDDIEKLIVSNILFSTQVAEAMALVGVHCLVNTGTSWQNFETEGYCPVNLYAATKQAFEDILSYYHSACKLSCITLKLYDTYGPGDTRRKLVNILIDAAMTGDPIELSPGEQLIELTHVDDVVSAFQKAYERIRESPLPLLESFLVSGTRLSVRALVKEISKATGRHIHAEWGKRPYRKREMMIPPSPAGKQVPGWNAKMDFLTGIASIMQHS